MLHRERSNPDDNKKENNSEALSVEEFMSDVTEGWKANKDVIAAGSGKQLVKTWYEAFGDAYAEKSKSSTIL